MTSQITRQILPGRKTSPERQGAKRVKRNHRSEQRTESARRKRAAKAAAATNKNKQSVSQRPDDSGARRGAPSQAPTTEPPPSITADVENKIRDLRIFSPLALAKSELYSRIDQYMQERILAADVAISTFGLAKIHGDVVLTYASISAHRAGKRFEVIVVDSRPMLEEICEPWQPLESHAHTALSALGTVMKDAYSVLGTHALHSNGALYSRAGTALVAMMAKQHNVPVLACCETYKFPIALTWIAYQERACFVGRNDVQTPAVYANANTNTRTPRDEFNLQLLNPLYDLTPPAYITAVVTEVGLIPVSSVPTVLGRPPQYANPNAPVQYGGQMGMMQPSGMMPPSMPATTAATDPYANAQPGTIAYQVGRSRWDRNLYTRHRPRNHLSDTLRSNSRYQMGYSNSSQASAAGIPSGSITASNAAQLPQAVATGYGYPPSPGDDYPVMKPGMSQREYETCSQGKKERSKNRDRDRDRDRDRWERDPQDPYDITGGRGGRERKYSGDFGLSRQSFYPPAGNGAPSGGYNAPVPGGYGVVLVRCQVPPSARTLPSIRIITMTFPTVAHLLVQDITPVAATHLLLWGRPTYLVDMGYLMWRRHAILFLRRLSALCYALARSPLQAPNSLYSVSGRELNRANRLPHSKFFLVEDLRELMQPQPPPLPAALVPHDVMAEEWDRCMQGLISLTLRHCNHPEAARLILGGSYHAVEHHILLPRGRDDRYFSSARREQRAAKRAERKARRKEKARRRRARRRQRAASIRIRAVPLH
ncbi:translation initiation factor eIF-2B beta subunit [Rhizoctonia solani]|uniref:Translation initiation factor eIF2B subunit delta n=1 Tax=Rhizoctonia solani TaxID=456999 RepID=A0A8H8NNP6_9AGAM|nr:translation initiation factor eIF-2B beta subunit [Rhizoctonia solani]QRW15997.1 translation initiation factor eIF-2B beta subunit [Rhizoctonia solani]